MARQTPKGITGNLKRINEELINDNSQNNNQLSNYDKLVADMAKGFMEAQAQMSKPANNNQEMLTLLGKMSVQIDEMKKNMDNNELNNTNQNSDNSSQQNEMITAQNIKDIFSSILQANNNQATQQNNGSNNNQATQSDNKIAVQAAAQVLAQAQYELSNELEASLNKLRQVISKSEKIANKISGLIGTEDNKQ